MSKMAVSLEKRLRFQFECSVIHWKKPKKDQFAHVSAENGKKVIDLPPGYSDDYTLRTLFHELSHVAIPGELSAFMDWEEDLLEKVVEPNLMAYVLSEPRLHEFWLSKLKEAGWVDRLKRRKEAK